MEKTKTLVPLSQSDKIRLWKKFYKLNNYYHSYVQRIALSLIPRDIKVIEFGCKGGELLAKLPNKERVGVEFDDAYVKYAKNKNKNINFFTYEEFLKLKKRKYDYILLSQTLGNLSDVQTFIKKIRRGGKIIYCGKTNS